MARRTPKHIPLLRVRIYIAEEEVEAVVDSGTSSPIVLNGLAYKLGICNSGRKIKVRQGDGRSLAGNFVGNTGFRILDSSSVVGKFLIDAEILYIRNWDVILSYSWLIETGFLIDS